MQNNPELKAAQSDIGVAAAQRVKRYIEHHGLALSCTAGSLPDHVSVELEFQAALARAEADALERGSADEAGEARAVQRRFFAEHVGAWVPTFCREALAQAPLPFYEGLLGLTLQFLDDEASQLMGPVRDRA